MLRLFFDSSALYAAILSSSGAAYELIQRAAKGEVHLIISQDVVSEVERNLERKAPELVSVLNTLLYQTIFEVVARPTQEEVWAAEEYIVQKDAFIVAAAKNAQVDYLVTFDRKHLIDPPEVAELSGLKIVTPGDVLEQL